MQTIVGAARESLTRLETERDVDTEFTRPFDLEPTPMADRLREAAHAAGETVGIETMDMHSPLVCR